MKSKMRVETPCHILGTTCMLSTDVVDSDIPLLLGKPSMKRMKVIIDMEQDKCFVVDQEVTVSTTKIGHYKLYLTKKKQFRRSIPIAQSKSSRPEQTN